MAFDKLCRINPAARVLVITRADERRDKFAHFKMEMRKIPAVRGPDGGDLLTAFHGFAQMNQHVLNVAVVGLHVFAFAIFKISVEQNNDVAPARPAVARQQHSTIRDRVNRVAEVAILAANSI